MTIRGLTHVSLSVSDLDRSIGFYRDLLGLAVFVDRFEGATFDGEEVMLAAGRTVLCLQAHRANPRTPFDPTRSGLDHLAFAVGSMAELETFADRLTEAGVAHGGIRPLPPYGHLLEERDPDGILIELQALDPDRG